MVTTKTIKHYLIKVGSLKWIKRRHSVLSNIILFFNSFISIFFLIVSLFVFLELPIPLLIWFPSIWHTLLTTKFTGLLSTCSNHLNLLSNIFSTIGATLSQMSSFFILSHLVFSHIQCNIIVSATFTVCSCWFFTTKHYVSYNIVGLIDVR